MIGFINGSKYFKTKNGLQVVLDNTTLLVEEGQKIGILCAAGEGKSTLIKILAGTEKLSSGLLIQKNTAWPLGYSGAFHPFLTAHENIQIIARLNYLDPFELQYFCQDFAELLKSELHLKMSSYSGNMRAKLGFALSLAIPCDFLLADEKLHVGDGDFKSKCAVALEQRLQHCGLIFLTRNPKLSQSLCEIHGVLQEGQITIYNSHEEATHGFKHDKILL